MENKNVTRYFTHEDDGTGAKVFYRLRLEEHDTRKPYLRLDLELMPNEIYHDSKFEKVLTPPPVVSLLFTFEETMMLMGVFTEAISVYMAAIRKALHRSDILRVPMEPTDGEYDILLHAVNKKYSGAGKGKNSARLILTVQDKKNGEEVLSVKMKKTKIVLLMQAVKTFYEEYVERFSFQLEDVSGYRTPLIRHAEMTAIGQIWIHGREIQKFQDFIERIIFDFKYNPGDRHELFNYRQVRTHLDTESRMVTLQLRKYDDRHRVVTDDHGEMIEHAYMLDSYVAAIFYLLLPRSTGFDTKDVEVRRSGKEGALEVPEDRHLMSRIVKGNFLLNTVETQIALIVDGDQKFDVKKRRGKIKLEARYRDFVLQDERYKVGRTDPETGRFLEADKLPKCHIDLKTDWLFIFALCAEAVHSVDMMRTDEYNRLTHQWRYKIGSLMGGEHYGIRTVIDPENKAPVVLQIDHYIDDFGELDYQMLPISGGSRMRIPLFKEHVRSLLKGLILLSSEFDNYYWVHTFPVYSDDNDEIKGRMQLGIRRFWHTKMKREVVSFGVIGRSTEQIYLTDNDRDALFFSAYYRLLYGRWLQFSGEQVAISFDGWITDRFHEYCIEFDMEASDGARGALAALAIVFATSRAKMQNPAKEEESNLAEN